MSDSWIRLILKHRFKEQRWSGQKYQIPESRCTFPHEPNKAFTADETYTYSLNLSHKFGVKTWRNNKIKRLIKVSELVLLCFRLLSPLCLALYWFGFVLTLLLCGMCFVNMNVCLIFHFACQLQDHTNWKNKPLVMDAILHWMWIFITLINVLMANVCARFKNPTGN